MKTLDVLGFKIKNLFKKEKTDMQIMKPIPNNALYFVLSGVNTDVALRPDLFPPITVNGNNLVMKSKYRVNVPYGQKNRFIIPFTDSDICINEYNNGVIEVNASYRLLVLDGADYTSIMPQGAYDLSSGIYEDVLITENWDSFEATTANRVAHPEAILRKSPVSIDLTPNMAKFLYEVNSNIIKLNY